MLDRAKRVGISFIGGQRRLRLTPSRPSPFQGEGEEIKDLHLGFDCSTEIRVPDFAASPV
ncbi:hypothetical protein QA635_03810 [Bradyrhizobium brasilense]|uniref:hypothetical protein n=1 Tax=Bradyrhizobium brasilense TaxID=1419277 RepID=UPI0024B174FE|nr:hypothetical protein [Bradyrhizobium australafricanum]WFU33590.1 hypothetical protein QA635_03810 [Bradyrhizobium australafricanum]